MKSPRNGIDVTHMMASEIENVDTLFETCDAEFNSRFDVYQSFQNARGMASWARYYLLREVRKISVRDGIFASNYMALLVSMKLAEIWYLERAREEHAAELNH